MLIKPTAEQAETYIDFAYSLALDPSRSGYPTYTDGIKTKEDFIDHCRYAFTRDDREVLLYVEDGEVKGWIQFLYEEEGRYLETGIFNIAGSIRGALEEFVAYCKDNFGNYDICMGFPGENREAIGYLTEIGWVCEERSYNDVLFFDNYDLLPEDGNVVRMTKENYPDFRMLHEPIEQNMYWNSARLYEALENWGIYVYYEDGVPTAAIYNRDAEILMHIYGVDYKDDLYRPEPFRALMASALNDCKRSGKKYMVYFGDHRDQEEVLKLGYSCVGEYVMFAKRV